MARHHEAVGGNGPGRLLRAREDQHRGYLRVPERWPGRAGLRCSATAQAARVMPSAGALCRPTWIIPGRGGSPPPGGRSRAAWSRRRAAPVRAGRQAMIRLRSGRKPMSIIRSASSRTRVCRRSKHVWFWRIWSSSRPGVATSTSTPARRAFSWPPVGRLRRGGRRAAACGTPGRGRRRQSAGTAPG